MLARKLLVLAVSVFLADHEHGLQVPLVMWIMAAATGLQSLCRPYQNATEQKLEMLSLSSTTVACMVGQLLLQGQGEEGLGVAGAAVCRAVVGVIIVGTSACFVAFFAREVRGAVRRNQAAASDARNNRKEGVAGSTPSIAMTENPMNVQGQHVSPAQAQRAAPTAGPAPTSGTTSSRDALKQRALQTYHSPGDVLPGAGGRTEAPTAERSLDL